MRILPYRVPTETVVAPEPWRLVLEGEEFPLPEAYPDWDYQTAVTLRRTVTIDLETTRRESGLTTDTPLALAVVWTSTGSKLRGTAARHMLSETGPVDLHVQLPGTDLGGVLLLDTALILARRRTGDERPTAARRGGSVLWSDRSELRLQGDAPQFPMAVIDFEKTIYPVSAAWHLELDSLETATMGSLLLLVNEKKSVVADALTNAARPRPQDRIVLAILYADIARTMVEHALHNSDFDDDSTYADGSLGATIQSLFHRLFPQRSVRDVRAQVQRSPSWLSTEVQASLNLFEGIA
ncbi:hypothetical protein ACFYTQ_00380 [Nocardia sp. NPDC004068]|uniref:hypothetical protein n=1 Tax=Nocardia sp. NPDC004068 TaxID=3364303 RepID=UPI0036A348E5